MKYLMKIKLNDRKRNQTGFIFLIVDCTAILELKLGNVSVNVSITVSILFLPKTCVYVFSCTVLFRLFVFDRWNTALYDM